MLKTDNSAAIADVRALLAEHSYNEDTLRTRLGAATPPTRDEHRRALYLTREATAQNALIRLFLLGNSATDNEADLTLGAEGVALLRQTGLIEARDGRVVPTAVIVPIGELLLASDSFEKLGTADAADFVLPASTQATTVLRRVALPGSVETTLDLGCGCGVLALLAARSSRTVVASDISPGAVAYTRFNALLNGIDNIDVRQGDLFETVAGEQFDRIVCNPPFVLSPGQEFTYRDNTLELDAFCALLVQQSAGFLKPGGSLQMLFESVEIDGEPWPDRIRAWADGTNADLWVLHNPPVHPARYVSQRASDIDGPRAGEAVFEPWLAWLQERRVTGIHPGVAVLRRRDGDNWFHLHHSVGEVSDDCGEAVAEAIAAQDFLAEHASDAALQQSTLTLSDHLLLEQQFARHNNDWRPHNSVMKLGNGLEMLAEVDLPIVAFMNQLDTQLTLDDCLTRFAEAVGAELPGLKKELLPVVRLFIGRGFIVPA